MSSVVTPGQLVICEGGQPSLAVAWHDRREVKLTRYMPIVAAGATPGRVEGQVKLGSVVKLNSGGRLTSEAVDVGNGTYDTRDKGSCR